jgi:carboxymethylenebutenolidase
MGGADTFITANYVEDFDKALTSAGLDHEVVSYPGAPHSFFDRSYEQHAEASKDAWQRILAFVEKNKK